MPVKTKPISMSMAPNKDYLQGWNDCHKRIAEEIVRQDAQIESLKRIAEEIVRQDAQIESLKRLLQRSQTPLRFASMHYLDRGLLSQENKTDALLNVIKRALKG